MAQSRRYNLTLSAAQRLRIRTALGNLRTYLDSSIDVYNAIPKGKREKFLSKNPILRTFISLVEKVDR